MKIRYIISISLIAMAFGFFQLLGNQRYSTELAKQIILKDKAGEDVRGDITNLTEYVHAHMRASVKFELVGSYQRAVAEAEAAAPPINGDIYSRAQAACGGRSGSDVQSRCVTAYVAANSKPGANLKPTDLPDPTKYSYILNSPAWAPDMAGLSLLGAAAGIALSIWLVFTRRLFGF